jgi:hypothetical protein
MTRRTEGDRDKRQALGKALKAMFRNVERRPVPEALHAVVDQLEAASEPSKSRARKA